MMSLQQSWKEGVEPRNGSNGIFTSSDGSQHELGAVAHISGDEGEHYFLIQSRISANKFPTVNASLLGKDYSHFSVALGENRINVSISPRCNDVSELDFQHRPI